ncbi:MAG: hypothetical protein A3C50_02940 [Candidatus Staskawiczbacteria bacterium RIFCSPHIGHO2_02_FULL_43_16]|uniref:Cupin type-2 domain-containing protein n=1 Tax=Candidatus Staskawiczbacteria bacterium RIFCSPHIGHO2_01_FULL_41_41 TaxID=1802203 RepID=A0A1G2HS28_9BACT|nr:MAG: hypothetical protein A2822_01155 [Candidatus Staskawiczbacteria bacterium RIFCSPHIGHO2_01_FULL_41_41]OGZ68571.1 MAG: hypothetical protein A3C50_02940 [Candidatus Staskawiczbacteria bacterium RIFCSPHIGHO2_02_FULL_43_16]
MQKFFFEDDGFIPNSRFPVIVTRKMVTFLGAGPVEAEVVIKNRAFEIGWNLEWLWPVFKRPHYHSTTHEALVVYQGSATLRLGGHRLGKLVKVSQGDAIVIPAGVAHQAVERTENFQVFGFYPVGAKHWDMIYCRKRERAIALPNLALHNEPPSFEL